MHRSPAACVLIAISVKVVAESNGHPHISLWPNGAPGSEARKSEPELARD